MKETPTRWRWYDGLLKRSGTVFVVSPTRHLCTVAYYDGIAALKRTCAACRKIQFVATLGHLEIRTETASIRFISQFEMWQSYGVHPVEIRFGPFVSGKLKAMLRGKLRDLSYLNHRLTTAGQRRHKDDLPEMTEAQINACAEVLRASKASGILIFGNPESSYDPMRFESNFPDKKP